MDTPDDSVPDNNSDKTRPEAKAARGDAAANDLPNVESPRLADAGADDETADHRRFTSALPALFRAPLDNDEIPEEPAPAATAQPRSFRFALLAASVAAAAGVGALFGALAASGFGHERVATASIAQTAEPHDVVAALKAQVVELSALKASLDAAKSNAGAQYTKINERLESLERAQADSTAKLAHFAEAIDRLGAQASAAPETTGSIAASPPPAPQPAPSATVSTPILHDWAVQNVRNGRAMVQTRYGSFFLVGSGSVLPGLGRVQEIKRQNGEWIVVTDKGLITSHP
ncbi:MAG TPA: hypothetical protein VMF12_11510 [Xanthobacteraceae bacterium]|nr:hypothetical protein [Xanthobacteraceae bacterium]